MREYAAVTAAKVGLDSELSAAVRGSDPERFQTNAIALEAASASSMVAVKRSEITKLRCTLRLSSPRRGRRVNRGRFRPLAAQGSRKL